MSVGLADEIEEAEVAVEVEAVEDQVEEASDAREETSPRARHTSLTIGLSFVTVGLCLLLFLGYLFSFTGLQEQRKQRQLLNVFTTPAGAVPLSGALPTDGQPAAILTIPSLHLRQVVIQGTTPAELSAGPGTMTDAARLGTKGNAVIMARRYTGGAPFAKLPTLKIGDKVHVTSGLGKFTYVVSARSATAVVGQKDPASPTSASQLTLISASSPTGAGRLYVVAKLVTDPGASKRPTIKPTPAELGVAGQPGALVPTVIWGLLLAAVLGVSFSSYRRWRSRIVVVYALSTPIVLATALMFYSQLYLLTPSTI